MTTERFESAVRAFDALNAKDERQIVEAGSARPRQLVEAERLSRWIDELYPDASEALRLAARCQHIERWRRRRSEYPEGRDGYLRWRKEASLFHARRAEEVLSSVGYEAATIERVRAIVQKQGLKRDSEVQAMEDALCLAFLEGEFSEFAARHPEEKVISVLRKTWRKMSERARAAALALEFSEADRALVARAVTASGG